MAIQAVSGRSLVVWGGSVKVEGKGRTREDTKEVHKMDPKP